MSNCWISWQLFPWMSNIALHWWANIYFYKHTCIIIYIKMGTHRMYPSQILLKFKYQDLKSDAFYDRLLSSISLEGRGHPLRKWSIWSDRDAGLKCPKRTAVSRKELWQKWKGLLPYKNIWRVQLRWRTRHTRKCDTWHMTGDTGQTSINNQILFSPGCEQPLWANKIITT